MADVSKVQESLAKKALLQPTHRFDDLFRYVKDEKWLRIAINGVLNSEGSKAPGIDGTTAENFPTRKEIATLAEKLSRKLRDGTYKPQPVKRVYIPKASGKPRPLGVPCIADRAVQEAIRMVLEPIYESDFLDCSHGFRPSRRTMDAIKRIQLYSNEQLKMFWVVKGDIKGCFDNIPHKRLMGVLRQRIKDKELLSLIRDMLAAGYLENGKVSTPNRGTFQGGIVSSLLANIYLHEMDKYWWERYSNLREQEKTRRRKEGLGNVALVRHADDFVLLTNGTKEGAYALKEEFKTQIEGLGLELSDEKTAVTHVNDGYDFLGFHIRRRNRDQKRKALYITPSRESMERYKEKLRAMTQDTRDDPVNKIRAINRVVRRWANYYRHVQSKKAFSQLTSYTHMRMFYWLKRKHSNVSAKGSIAKYVIRNYLTRDKEGWRTWGVAGVTLYAMNHTKIKRYYTKKVQGNVYLTKYEDLSLKYKEETPISDDVWVGNSPQSRYAIARAERLEEVGYRCEECGAERDLDAHHRDPQMESKKHGKGNLIILCKDCHKKKTCGKKGNLS